MDNYFKKGAYVIYHYKEWQEVLWSNSGWGWVSKWKHAVMLENPRDEYGRFTTNFKYESDVTVKLMDEDGKVFKATLEDIERDVDPATLNEDDFKKIYREIARGSIFYSDYTNSLGVFQNTLYDYYEGFLSENSTAGEKWKTNADYMVNRKFIVPYMCVYESYGYKNTYVEMNSYGSSVDKINDIVKALCFLTGKPYEWKEVNANGQEVDKKLPSLWQFSREKSLDWGEWYEWTFFRVKCYKKGTVHFEFLDEDVWYKFNQSVAKQKGWNLPQKTNKTKEERRRKTTSVAR